MASSMVAKGRAAGRSHRSAHLQTSEDHGYLPGPHTDDHPHCTDARSHPSTESSLHASSSTHFWVNSVRVTPCYLHLLTSERWEQAAAWPSLESLLLDLGIFCRSGMMTVRAQRIQRGVHAAVQK